MGTPTTYFNEREHQICLVARMRIGIDGETER